MHHVHRFSQSDKLWRLKVTHLHECFAAVEFAEWSWSTEPPSTDGMRAQFCGILPLWRIYRLTGANHLTIKELTKGNKFLDIDTFL